MLIYKKYDEKILTEKAWFDSSMIIYTRMVEDPNENYGELYITYKGGATYVYHNVSFQDYVVFIGGGTDGSHGKTINKIIKGQYEFEKLEPLNEDDLKNELQILLEEKKNEEAELQNSPVLKWERLMNSIKNTYDYMSDIYLNKQEDINEELYNSIIDYLNNTYSIVKDI